MLHITSLFTHDYIYIKCDVSTMSQCKYIIIIIAHMVDNIQE